MEQAMLTWGAIRLECPNCHRPTPIYTHDIFGGNSSVSCLNCGVSLQYKEGEAVIAEFGTAKEEDIMKSQEAALQSCAEISHLKLGVPKHKLAPDLQKRLPKESIGEKLRRILRII